jgi:two-component system, OmpR family, response regulator
VALLLVVEDEPDILALVERRATAAGHQVLAADGLESAHELVREHGAPDAAVLDVDLPGTDGFTLLEELRRRTPNLPAVFITALWSPDVPARAARTGSRLLPKPFALPALDAAIDHLTAAAAEAGPLR